MSENHNWTNLGEQFLGSVAEALNTGDFSGLNDLLSDTASAALQEARRQAAREKERQKEKVQKQYDEWQETREARMQEDRERREAFQQEQMRRRQELQEMQARRQQELREQSIADAQTRQALRTPAQIARDMRRLVKTKRVGSVSSVLYTVFGAIGLGLTSIGLVAGIFSVLFMSGSAVSLVVCLILALVSVCVIHCGTTQKARLNRSERYMQLCGYKMYGMLEDLAKQTGKSLKYVRKDLRKMLKMGFFPEGHMDEKETCFMLNDAVYHQYEQASLSYRQAEEEAKRLEEAARAPKSLAEQMEEERRAREAELNAMVAEGMDYTRRLRELNDAIPGEPISGKLFQLENLLKEIFDRVREHPEQMHRMHKLMDYYLPTTLKLVEAYKEFSEVSVPGEDILSAMEEIEKTLDTINLAFRELLNALFQDAALDATTDAQVLQTMLAREGLTRELEPIMASAGNAAANPEFITVNQNNEGGQLNGQ